MGPFGWVHMLVSIDLKIYNYLRYAPLTRALEI